MAEAKTTTDHETIRRRAAERGGKLAALLETGGNGGPGILRIDFPGRGDDDRLEKISWEEFFDAFDQDRLAFLYRERTEDGDTSRFDKPASRVQKAGRATGRS